MVIEAKENADARKVVMAMLLPLGLGLMAFVEAALIPGRSVSYSMVAALFFGNALWFSIPHLFVLVTTFWNENLRPLTIPKLWLLNGYLVAFDIWVQTQFSSRDAAFVWVAYWPGAFLVLLGYRVFQRILQPSFHAD